MDPGLTFQKLRGSKVARNTKQIIENCDEPSTAARMAADYRGGGKDDWFLPSVDELRILCSNLYEDGIGNFTNDFCWTFSEFVFDDGIAISLLFNAGDVCPESLSASEKQSVHRVRAVRVFQLKRCSDDSASLRLRGGRTRRVRLGSVVACSTLKCWSDAILDLIDNRERVCQ